ncbi:hypothetical protein HPP92_001601 [Vanilla planifolia]|uniref:Uncharacterized protein n=1 Tax=Vanilla planifolia TaxID=51239 RepID=A0A835S028_VANPL|nr:hypothetical protein HPP92_001601 [Vanilla planifolia]
MGAGSGWLQVGKQDPLRPLLRAIMADRHLCATVTHDIPPSAQKSGTLGRSTSSVSERVLPSPIEWKRWSFGLLRPAFLIKRRQSSSDVQLSCSFQQVSKARILTKLVKPPLCDLVCSVSLAEPLFHNGALIAGQQYATTKSMCLDRAETNIGIQFRPQCFQLRMAAVKFFILESIRKMMRWAPVFEI